MTRRIRLHSGIAAALVLAGFLIGAGDAPDPEAGSGRPIDADGSGPPGLVLQLTPGEVERAGIGFERVSASEMTPEVRGYGSVLDPAAAIGAATRWFAARAQAHRAARDLARVRDLAADDGNASARELEAAQALSAVARSERDLAEATVTGLLGRAVVTAPGLPSLVERLVRREVALVRLDVPAGEDRPEPEAGAVLVEYPGPVEPLSARYLGPAPDANPVLPGWGLLFVVSDHPPPAGTPIHGAIRTNGAPRAGVDVAASAMIRRGGDVFVFVKDGKHRFRRREVTGRSRSDGRWFVARGLRPGDEVVVTGAQQLLSRQFLGGSPAESD